MITDKKLLEYVDETPMEYVIGRKYHCSWAKNRGFVWKLISYDDKLNEAILETPKTRRRLTTKLSSLRNINKYLTK